MRDSTYLDPVSLEPFSGSVYRSFEHDSTRIQLQGTLQNGTWQGELTVYHPNGRLRFQGELIDGVQCGTWLENPDPEPPESVYEEIVAELQNLSLYPPCPE